MKAVVHDRYGPPSVLHLEDVRQPLPGADEVLVKVHATTVNRTDDGVRSGRPLALRPLMAMFGVGGVLRPKHRVLGSEFAGDVEAIGDGVLEFKVGDRVFGCTAGAFGAHAELVCLKASAALAHMPIGVTYVDAAGVCDGGILALECLRRAELRAGRSILVYGASGSIGTAGVQLAKDMGAEVTAVCNTKNVEIVRSLGADDVVDYTREDFTATGRQYDVIFDAAGKLSFPRCRRALKGEGIFLATDRLRNIAFMLASRWIGKKKAWMLTTPRYTKEDVIHLKGLIESGRYRAVIDRTYPLADVVEATRYVGTEQKTGNVVLTVISSPER